MQNLAQENLSLFIHCFVKGHPALQTIALQIITDILITHPTLLADPSTSTTDASQSEQNDILKPVLAAFKKSLKSDDPSVQSTGATALAKAMLSQLITDGDLLRQLVVLFFDPDSASNPQLRQSLSYFLPVYCHSRAENALRMAEIATSVLSKLQTLRASMEEDPDEDVDVLGAEGMVSLTQVGTMLLDWTDPRKIVGFSEVAKDSSVANGAGEAHYVIAHYILDRLCTHDMKKEDKKPYFAMLNKVHLPAGGAESQRIKDILELAVEAIETKVAPTLTDKAFLTKIQKRLLEVMHDIMTEERGGGGEETVIDATEAATEQTEVEDETTVHARPGSTDVDDEEVEEGDDATQLQQEFLRDATLGATTTTGFVPDAEGTRIGLGDVDDTEVTGDVDGDTEMSGM